MSKKLSLVLEGGGMRGAYTAGCLSWLIDNNIEFDGAYAISVGAVHLASFLFKNKSWLKNMSTVSIARKKYIGVPAYLKEGQIVSFEAMFKELEEDYGFDVTKLKTKTNAKIGYYDLGIGETVYIPIKELNNEMMKAACSLPLLGKKTIMNGKEYLDGGITKMIPIEESVKDGYDKHLIITTKPITYVRKPAKKIVAWLMEKAYPNCLHIGKDYTIRHVNYRMQIALIESLVAKKKAIYRYPTKESKVTRLGGTVEQLNELYEMGYSDMEAIKKDIFKLVE